MKTPLALAALGLALAAVPAAANTQTVSVTVQYGDLNLDSEKGQARLERRLDKAARGLCEVDSQRTGSRIVPHSVRECYRQAKASSQRQYAAVVERRALGG